MMKRYERGILWLFTVILCVTAFSGCTAPQSPEEARNQWDSYQTETWLDRSYYVVPVKEGGDPLFRVAVDSGFKEEYLEPVRQLFIGSPGLAEQGFYVSGPEYQDDRIAYYWAYRIHKSGSGGASWTQNEQVLMILEKGTEGNWSAGYVLGSTDADPSEPGNGRFEEAFRPLKEKLEPGFGLTDSEMEEVKAFVTQKMTEPPFVMTENGGPSEEVIREYRDTLQVIYDREWSGKAIDAAWERPGEGVSDLIAVVYVKPVREPESEEAKKLSASIFSDAEPVKIYSVHRSEKGGELRISRVIDSNVFPAIE